MILHHDDYKPKKGMMESEKVRTIFVSRYTHPANGDVSTLLEDTITLLLGWTASNDRRENVWMLVSSSLHTHLLLLAALKIIAE